MRINSEILEQYLESGNIEVARKQDVLQYLKSEAVENHWDEELSYTGEELKVMEKIAKELRKGMESFSPNNLELWETLFPNWKEITKDVMVYLLVGLPKGYDALALHDEQGSPIIIFDVGNWLAYKELNIGDVMGNLLTHELGHICIYHAFPQLEETSSMEYQEQLNAICFDEGFAHLLSFENKEIDSILWNEERFGKIYKDSVSTMRLALMEEDRNRQEEYIEYSMTGRYEDKFGAMMGMLYLAQEWINSGNSGLKVLFHKGYEGFLVKILVKDKV